MLSGGWAGYAPVQRNIATCATYHGGPWTVPRGRAELDGALLFLFQTATIRRAMETMTARHLSRAVQSGRGQPSSNTCICTTGRSRTTFSSFLQQRGINTDAGRLGFNAALEGKHVSGMLIARTRAHFDAFRETEIVEQVRMGCTRRADLEDIYLRGMNCNDRMTRPNSYVSL